MRKVRSTLPCHNSGLNNQLVELQVGVADRSLGPTPLCRVAERSSFWLTYTPPFDHFESLLGRHVLTQCYGSGAVSSRMVRTNFMRRATKDKPIKKRPRCADLHKGFPCSDVDSRHDRRTNHEDVKIASA